METFSPTRGEAVPVTVVTQESCEEWQAGQSAREKKWLKVNRFTGAPGKTCLIPAADGSLSKVVLGISDPLEIWDTAGLARNLPDGIYRLEGVRGKDASTRAALGWALGGYRFDAYRKPTLLKTSLRWPKACDKAHVTRAMEATFLVRNLINTPADDMGPSELEKAARTLARQHGLRSGPARRATLGKKLPRYSRYWAGERRCTTPARHDLGTASGPKSHLGWKGRVFRHRRPRY